MKNYLFNFILLLIFSFSSQHIGSQSISGNLSSFGNSNLAFGNVNIFSGDKLVASVLTDADGNFNVKLDSGEYRCEILFAGYEKIIHDLNVSSDMKMDFTMKEDIDSKFKPSKAKAPVMDAYLEEKLSGEPRTFGGTHPIEITKPKTAYKTRPTTMKYIAPSEKRQPGIMVLTGGEINDFKKWNEWKGIVSEDLTAYITTWNMNPRGRYVVAVKNENGFPIVGAITELKDESGKTLFAARTDNTGKAELWEDVAVNQQNPVASNILVQYHEQKEVIKNLSYFEQGINQIVLKSDCKISSLVEIAFVVDATGSMNDEIDFLKEELNHVIYNSKSNHPDLHFRFANVFYRDHGDQYLTKSMDFTDVLSEAVYFIQEQSAIGGGDYEEAVEIALDSAVNHLNWSTSARTKLLFLVLDAPPHRNHKVQQSLMNTAKEAAKKGIRIVPIVASGSDKSNEYLMRSLALMTNGTYLYLTGHSGVGSGHIAPSTKEETIESLNEMLVRIIQNSIYYPDCDKTDDIDDEKNKEITCWPNPATEIINVNVNEEIDYLYLMDLSGKIVARTANKDRRGKFVFNTEQFAKGIYFIGYEKAGEWKTTKVILV